VAVAAEHLYVYTPAVKRRELERRLRQAGWYLLRHGAAHDVWTNGQEEEPVPRHSEINKNLARKILKKAGAK
jgi:mRNA interferase HicA